MHILEKLPVLIKAIYDVLVFLECTFTSFLFSLFSSSGYFLQWGVAYCVRGGAEKERAAVKV